MKKANLKILSQKLKKHIKMNIPVGTLLNIIYMQKFSIFYFIWIWNTDMCKYGGLSLCLEAYKMVNCAKCGKEIPSGQEVKKGFLIKKSYHKECASQ
jgi:hypothetical protein